MRSSHPDYRGRRVLVAGGLGFIGLNLVAALRRAGAHVSVLGRSWPSGTAGLAEILEGVTVHLGDIRDESILSRAVVAQDVIFNLAGRSGAAASNAQPFEDLDINCRGQLTLLEVCRRLNPTVTIVFASSRLVYSPTASNPVAETDTTKPISVYGTHKLAAENYHLLYSYVHGLHTSVLRMTNPYGPWQRPGQSRYGIINWFINLALEGRSLPVYGDGSQLRDYVHVDDVAMAFLLAGERSDNDARVFNVGSGLGIPFVEMAKLVVAAVGGGSIHRVPWPHDVARVETGDFVADISAIESELGWCPRTALADGISKLVSDLRSVRSVSEPARTLVAPASFAG